MQHRYKIFLCIGLSAWIYNNVATAQEQTPATARNITLKEAINYGLEHHPTVRIFRLQTLQAKQVAKEQLSNYLPQVNLSSTLDYNIELQKTVIPEGTFGPGTPKQIVAFGQKYNASLAGQADQQIFNMSLISGLQANKPNNELARLSEEENRQEIIYNISNAYFQIITIKKQLDLLYANKERFEKIMRVASLQSDLGVAKKVDVKQVQVNLNNVTTQITNLENNLSLAENQLKNHMGLPVDAQVEIQDFDTWTEKAEVHFQPQLFNFHNTYSFLKQEKQLELLSINKRRLRNGIFPVISAYAQYGYLGFGNSLESVYNPLLDFSKVGLKLSWSLFTGLRRDAQYKQASLDYDIARINLSFNEQIAGLQFQNAKLKLSNANSTISLNRQNMELAREVFDNTTLQYNEGVASLAELLNAELSFREAQNNYINALVEYYRADLDVQKSNNTLTEFYNNLK